MSNKVTKKQIRANEALEKRKYQRRLSKANPRVQITADVVNTQIAVSHVDRIQNMLPPGIKVYGMFSGTKPKKIDPKRVLPYQSHKKYVHWLAVNLQDAGSSVSLTKEIEEFSKYVGLDQGEIDSRENMLRELHETILSKWSSAVINQFGSYSVGLSTFMSDLDISIMNMGVDNDSSSTSSSVPTQKHDNHIIQTQFVGSGSIGLAQLQASTGMSNRSMPKDADVIDLTGVDLLKSNVSSKRKRNPSEGGDDQAQETISDTDSDYKNSKYNVELPSVTQQRAMAEESRRQKVVDLVSSNSDESSGQSSEEDSDEEVTQPFWKIDTRPGHEDAQSADGEELINEEDDKYETSSSDDSRDSRYESVNATGINEDSMTEADLEELNRLYEAEEKAMADVDDDDSYVSDSEVRVRRDDIDIGSINDDSSSASSDAEGEAVVQNALDKNIQNRKRRRRDSGDDDSYYSEGDVYNRHKQNELFRTIKDKIRSSDNLVGDHLDAATAAASAKDTTGEKEVKEQEDLNEDIEGESSDGDGNDSLTRLLLMNQSDSNSDSESEYDEEQTKDDLEHSLIVGGSAKVTNNDDTSFSRKSFQSSSTTAVVDKEAELERHRKQLNLLKALFPHLRGMNWLAKAELRSRARVPIINLQHKNSIECDISVGVSAQDTSHIVQELKEFCGPALLALSSFLKVFLNQFDLDKPFSGGLGSYKLYVIIAAHVDRNQSMIADKLKPDLGNLLISFFKYYGNPRNFNLATTVKVLSAEVCLDRTNRVGELQKLFEVAHDVLHKVVQKRLLHSKLAVANGNTISTSSGNSGQPLIIKPGESKGSSNQQQQQMSSSALACLLNCEELCRLRVQYRHKCRDYPLIPESDLVSMAQSIVDDLERRLAFPKGLTVAEIQRINPCLYARLRSFSSVEAAVRHLGGRDSTFAPGTFQRTSAEKAMAANGASGSGDGFPRTKSMPNLANGKGFGRNSIPQGEYKFSFNGVVGNSITDLPSATNKRVKYNKTKAQKTRHSFGGFPQTQGSALGKRPHQSSAGQNHHQLDAKRVKSVEPSIPVVIPPRYNNTKSGFSFSNVKF